MNLSENRKMPGRKRVSENSGTGSGGYPLAFHRPLRQFQSHALAAALVSLFVIVCGNAAMASGNSANEPSVDELKARLASANIPDRPRICVQIAERQMAETTKLYAATEDEKAQAALTDVIAFSELARDYAIQSHKYQKQSEIAVREMIRKLTELMHTLGHDDQAPIRNALTRMDRVRDDLLLAMFPKGQR
jgi:hypothetical protein